MSSLSSRDSSPGRPPYFRFEMPPFNPLINRSSSNQGLSTRDAIAAGLVISIGRALWDSWERRRYENERRARRQAERDRRQAERDKQEAEERAQRERERREALERHMRDL